MNTCPVTDPSAVEKRLFDAGLIERVPLAETNDVKAGTSAQRASIDPQVYRVKRDVHNPDDWGNELWANTRREWFAHVLQPGGLFAFEQWPADPDSPPRERILWFIDDGPPSSTTTPVRVYGIEATSSCSTPTPHMAGGSPSLPLACQACFRASNERRASGYLTRSVRVTQETTGRDVSTRPSTPS